MDNDSLNIINRKKIQNLMKSNINYNCKACNYLYLYDSMAHTLCLSCKYSHSKDYSVLKSNFNFCSSIEIRKRLRDLNKKEVSNGA